MGGPDLTRSRGHLRLIYFISAVPPPGGLEAPASTEGRRAGPRPPRRPPPDLPDPAAGRAGHPRLPRPDVGPGDGRFSGRSRTGRQPGIGRPAEHDQQPQPGGAMSTQAASTEVFAPIRYAVTVPLPADRA